jgi:hypothetical protein
MYGKRKLIAKRTPLFPSGSGSGPGCRAGSSTSTSTPRASTSTALPAIGAANQDHDHDHELADVLSTPTVTEGETATETETEPETTEAEMDDRVHTQIQPSAIVDQDTLPPGRHSTQKKAPTRAKSKPRQTSIASILSTSSYSTADDAGASANNSRKTRGLSQHDLLNKYFRRDAVVLRNVDLLRYVYRPFSHTFLFIPHRQCKRRNVRHHPLLRYPPLPLTLSSLYTLSYLRPALTLRPRIDMVSIALCRSGLAPERTEPEQVLSSAFCEELLLSGRQ